MRNEPRDWTVNPPMLDSAYKSTTLRSPRRPMVTIEQGLSETTGPGFDGFNMGEFDHDLTLNATGDGPPLGERIIVAGQVRDGDGRPLANVMIELWQANAAGRYLHHKDEHPAPIDSNFNGAGRVLTDADGRYSFTTIKPGAYPWGNHDNAWRPAHIHFSVLGFSIATRLITQMYFPGDPLLEMDPIFLSVPERSRHNLVSCFDDQITEANFALGYRFDIVLRGSDQTPADRH